MYVAVVFAEKDRKDTDIKVIKVFLSAKKSLGNVSMGP